MRLFLSSFRLGGQGRRLVALAGAGHQRRAVVIGNALDYATADQRHEGVERELVDLRELGFDAVEVDLRDPPAAARLETAHLMWVRGGNVFSLRQALRDSDLEQDLVRRIRADDVVYAGYSAGPAVLAPSLHGLDRVDDVTVVDAPIWEGLGVLDRPFVPHVNSPSHPESARCDLLSRDLTRQGTEHWAVRDGEVLLVDGDHTEVLGRR
jgi:dipeptidase E